MLTKFIAKLGITIGQGVLIFANYWYAFHLWPVSWAAFILCCCGQIALLALSMSIDAESN